MLLSGIIERHERSTTLPRPFTAYGGLLEANLFLTFEELTQRLVALTSGRSGRPGPRDAAALVDRFLVAAALSQLLEDYLHRDVLSLSKVAKYARAVPGAGGLLSGVVNEMARVGTDLRRWLPRERKLSVLQRELAATVAQYARTLTKSGGERQSPEPGTATTASTSCRPASRSWMRW